jgi:hypothetical protein
MNLEMSLDMSPEMSLGFAMRLLVVGILFSNSPVLAQQPVATLNYVSQSGNDTSSCGTLGNPCRTIEGAAANTYDGGFINCVNGTFLSGGTISRSVTIDCAGVQTSIISGIIIDGANANVTIKNLEMFEGFDSRAIWFKRGASLRVENVKISGANLAFNGISPAGLMFAPSNLNALLVVVGSSISGSGAGTAGGGIVVNPQAGGSARVMLDHVTVDRNVFGVAVDGTGSTGGINMTISNSVLAANSQDGIVATTPAGGAPIGIMIRNTTSANNNYGVRSLGPNVTIRLDSSSVIGNAAGLSFAGGGALLSYGNNNVEANGSNGAFSGSAALK